MQGNCLKGSKWLLSDAPNKNRWLFGSFREVSDCVVGGEKFLKSNWEDCFKPTEVKEVSPPQRWGGGVIVCVNITGRVTLRSQILHLCSTPQHIQLHIQLIYLLYGLWLNKAGQGKDDSRLFLSL